MEDPPTDTSERSGPKLEELGELVVQGFVNLEREINSEQQFAHEATRTVPVDVEDSREVLYDRLNLTFLPLLKDQLATMPKLLAPASMMEKPESKLKRLMEIQSELDYNITQINSTFLVLCPQYTSAFVRTNDQHLKQFKAYRLFFIPKRIPLRTWVDV